MLQTSSTTTISIFLIGLATIKSPLALVSLSTFWSAESGGVSSLLETSPDTYVSSLKWSGDGAYVSVGLGTGEVQIWDVEEQTKLRSMFGHETRVSVMGMSNTLLAVLLVLILSQVGTSTISPQALVMAGYSITMSASPSTRLLTLSLTLVRCAVLSGALMARN